MCVFFREYVRHLSISSRCRSSSTAVDCLRLTQPLEDLGPEDLGRLGRPGNSVYVCRTRIMNFRSTPRRSWSRPESWVDPSSIHKRHTGRTRIRKPSPTLLRSEFVYKNNSFVLCTLFHGVGLGRVSFIRHDKR